MNQSSGRHGALQKLATSISHILLTTLCSCLNMQILRNMLNPCDMRNILLWLSAEFLYG